MLGLVRQLPRDRGEAAGEEADARAEQFFQEPLRGQGVEIVVHSVEELRDALVNQI